jgi:hypothetical protein
MHSFLAPSHPKFANSIAQTLKCSAASAGLFLARPANWTPPQAAYRFSTCGTFPVETGRLLAPFFFRTRYDAWRDAKLLGADKSKRHREVVQSDQGLWVHSTAGWRRQRCVCLHLCGRKSRPLSMRGSSSNTRKSRTGAKLRPKTSGFSADFVFVPASRSPRLRYVGVFSRFARCPRSIGIKTE